MTLNDLKVGGEGVITAVNGGGELRLIWGLYRAPRLRLLK